MPEVEPGGRASSARDVKLSGWGCTEEAQPTKPTVKKKVFSGGSYRSTPTPLSLPPSHCPPPPPSEIG